MVFSIFIIFILERNFNILDVIKQPRKYYKFTEFYVEFLEFLLKLGDAFLIFGEAFPEELCEPILFGTE